MSQAWIVRAGRDGDYEEVAFEHNVVPVGWAAVGDLTPYTTRDAIRRAVSSAYPEAEPRVANGYAVQLMAFRCHMTEGDLVLMLRRSSPDVAIGRITGPYRYRTDLARGVGHVRAVSWLRTNVPRAAVAQALVGIPALTVIFRINQVGAVDRLRQLVPESDLQSSDLAQDSPPPVVEEVSDAFANLRRNLNYARSLATAGLHLAQLQVGSFEVADVFRAAWVQSVAALDHWVHQEILDRMLVLAQKTGVDKPKKFNSFPVTLGLLEQVQSGSVSLIEALAKQVRQELSRTTYQQPDRIREGLALVSNVDKLWERVAKVLSEEGGEGIAVTGPQVTDRLREIVHRRNKIAHENDEDPANQPAKRPIDAAGVTEAIDWIEQVAAAILIVLADNEAAAT